MSKDRELFEKIADDVFRRSIEQLEKDLAEHDPVIITEKDLLNYIDQRLNIMRAHLERYATELVWRSIQVFSAGK
mgnify:CR=1 FL=1